MAIIVATESSGHYNLWQPELQGYWTDVISFGMLMCIVAFFPLVVNNTPIFFVNGISLAVFLYFGLFVEVILTQIAVLVLMVKLRLRKSELFRIPLNMLMFLTLSVFAAAIYELLGGKHGNINFSSVYNFLPTIAYIVAVFTANQVLLKFFQFFFYRERIKMFDRGLLWEFSTVLLVLPVGFSSYILYIPK